MSTPASTARLASSELPTVSITVAPARMRFLNVRATGERPAQKYETIRTSSSRQMAAALLDHHAAGRVLVRSAGTVPAGEINPAVVVVMGELCIDLSKEFPKPLTTEAVEGSDVVVTMAAALPVPSSPASVTWIGNSRTPQVS